MSPTGAASMPDVRCCSHLIHQKWAPGVGGRRHYPLTLRDFSPHPLATTQPPPLCVQFFFLQFCNAQLPPCTQRTGGTPNCAWDPKTSTLGGILSGETRQGKSCHFEGLNFKFPPNVCVIFERGHWGGVRAGDLVSAVSLTFAQFSADSPQFEQLHHSFSLFSLVSIWNERSNVFSPPMFIKERNCFFCSKFQNFFLKDFCNFCQEFAKFASYFVPKIVPKMFLDLFDGKG